MHAHFGWRRRLLAGAAMGLVLAAVGPARAQDAVNAGEVSATGAATTPQGATRQPTQQEVFHSNQSIRVLDKAQLQAAGPVGGAAQALAITPGANVTGYGNSGATKYNISIDGIHQGWGGYGGYTDNGSLGVTFDGVPIVDPLTGLWQSPTIPQLGMIQNVNVTYGPGQPVDRWYTNIGGSVEFTPVQPTLKPGGALELTYGSYDQKSLDFNLRTGSFHGW
ncbi:MAG: TonB-dependent receptor, partial [Rhodospirillales bacterium]|nr:TonB-dependent receptor [Rhodospirillales bacterium]